MVVVLCSFALTAYAGIRLLDGHVLGVVLWFAGAAVLHDFVLVPLYSLADRALRTAGGRMRRPRGARTGEAAARREDIAYVRVPAFVSLVLLLVWYPLISGRVGHYTSYTTLDSGVFMGRWLLVTAALFAVSALCLAVRTLRRRGRGRKRRARRAASADR
ncbi:hypothetical protein HCC61_14545 [Streptomyces sp. HNM0575]|uniref:hypothetical protein n=1 Tax=Streptomyces sp. HNM0575 TaxID=2716338 RepID=UPI00145C4E05|nr:hypothetical protein [Streptomyces sp. HNM0575]NLU73884.1 hypothetical protein [Streptomyces sp. HNM0575]